MTMCVCDICEASIVKSCLNFFCLSASADVMVATNALGKHHVLGLNGDTLGVDRCGVAVLIETNQICLGGLLDGQDSLALESQVVLEILGDLTHETLEGRFSDQEIGCLLIFTDLTKRNDTRAELFPLGFDDLSVRFFSSLFTCFGKGGRDSDTDNKFSCGLLGSGHIV